MIRAGSIILSLTMLVLALIGTAAEAEVTRIEIQSRGPFADGTGFGDAGAYEKIRGRLHYAVDPHHLANVAIIDLEHAPRDVEGRVHFSADFLLIAPADPAKGSGRLLYEVGNRGNVGMLAFFNDAPYTNDPATREDAGNGFLLNAGYSLLWSAWNWDVAPGNGRMQIDLPVATRESETITGKVSAEIVTDAPSVSEPVAWGNSRGYETADLDDPGAVLTVRPTQFAERRTIPREQWRFARVEDGQPIPDPTHVYLPAGFQPGMIYELVYTAKDPRVVGLGLAAIRDALSFFRYEDADVAGNANPLAGAGRPEAAIAFGISQSARVIQHMLYEGLHTDEAQRPVFDAAFIHMPGGGKGSFNHRFAQTTRHPSQHHDLQYPADFFPFATTPKTDPVTGQSGDVLARARASGHVPHLFYTSTSTEYWTRSASLLHAGTEGATDVPLDPTARLYFLAGAQHVPRTAPHRGIYRHCGNPLDYRPLLRGLLTKLDDWATAGEAPPESVYPTIAAGTLGTVEQYGEAFPEIPGAEPPPHNLKPPRLDLGPRYAAEGIIENPPPGFGPVYETLVPMPDEDGNPLGGVELPEVALPLGTYVGWNDRAAEAGAEGALARWSGSFFPLPPDEAAREESGDPRRSIAARYPTRTDYQDQTFVAARRLVRDGFMLEQDVHLLVGKAGRLFRRMSGGVEASDCGYLANW